ITLGREKSADFCIWVAAAHLLDVVECRPSGRPGAVTIGVSGEAGGRRRQPVVGPACSCGGGRQGSRGQPATQAGSLQ
ncbi:unnamed protein product, partial [Urochloa humidicola]